MCREVGVDVANGALITGQIVEMNVADAQKVQAVCQSPFAPKLGCTMPVAPHEYVIWVTDYPRVIVHEQCHALFEAKHL